jgi:hypothetical protein
MWFKQAACKHTRLRHELMKTLKMPQTSTVAAAQPPRQAETRVKNRVNGSRGNKRDSWARSRETLLQRFASAPTLVRLDKCKHLVRCATPYSRALKTKPRGAIKVGKFGRSTKSFFHRPSDHRDVPHASAHLSLSTEEFNQLSLFRCLRSPSGRACPTSQLL